MINGAIVQCLLQATRPVSPPNPPRIPPCRQHSIKIFVENKPKLEPRIAALLNEEELQLFDDAKVKRQICVTRIRQLAHDSGLPTEQFIAMDSVIQHTWVRASDAVRINYQVG